MLLLLLLIETPHSQNQVFSWMLWKHKIFIKSSDVRIFLQTSFLLCPVIIRIHKLIQKKCFDKLSPFFFMSPFKNRSKFECQPIRKHYIVICIIFFVLTWQKRWLMPGSLHILVTSFFVIRLSRTTKIIFYVCLLTHFARQDRQNRNLKNKQNHATKVTKIQKNNYQIGIWKEKPS